MKSPTVSGFYYSKLNLNTAFISVHHFMSFMALLEKVFPERPHESQLAFDGFAYLLLLLLIKRLEKVPKFKWLKRPSQQTGFCGFP